MHALVQLRYFTGATSLRQSFLRRLLAASPLAGERRSAGMPAHRPVVFVEFSRTAGPCGCFYPNVGCASASRHTNTRGYRKYAFLAYQRVIRGLVKFEAFLLIAPFITRVPRGFHSRAAWYNGGTSLLEPGAERVREGRTAKSIDARNPSRALGVAARLGRGPPSFGRYIERSDVVSLIHRTLGPWRSHCVEA